MVKVDAAFLIPPCFGDPKTARLCSFFDSSPLWGPLHTTMAVDVAFLIYPRLGDPKNEGVMQLFCFLKKAASPPDVSESLKAGRNHKTHITPAVCGPCCLGSQKQGGITPAVSGSPKRARIKKVKLLLHSWGPQSRQEPKRVHNP